jgi:N-acetylglucosaminyldiphosphoundecaprenol N-acetyl-beta-D-mannosaminyltransferase
MPTDPRVEFLDIDFDAVTMDGALALLAVSESQNRFGYVVTPNVDHLVRLHAEDLQSRALGEAYRSASLCLCDSRVLSRLASLCGIRLPVVTGSDLTAELFRNVIRPGDRIGIVGGDTSLVETLSGRFPDVEFVQHRPPMGLSSNDAALDEAATFVAKQQTRFSFLAVGSPQQEMIASRIALIPDASGTALCVGASLQFLVGQERRAPRIVRRLGGEWAFRLLVQPRKMWRRYLVEGPRIFVIAWRWRKRSELRPV